MSDNDALGCFALLIISALALGLSLFAADYACSSRWPVRFQPRFKITAGCTIQTKDGRIPAANYRVL